MQKPVKIILGIDPGMVIMGFSIIVAGPGRLELKEMDVLKLPVKKDNYERLRLIYQKVHQLVSLHQPHEMAIEAPFFGKNVQSMLKLGRAQGVAIAAAMSQAIPVSEYSPKRIKQAITGNGNADKEQIWKMLVNMVSIPDKPKYFDATDALAVAICHHFSDGIPVTKKPTRAKSGSAWEKFASDNPTRVS